MLKTTLGRLLINEALPDDMRDYERVLDKKGMGTLATDLAKKYPDRYREVMKKIHDVSRDVAYTTGGMSMGLKHIRPTQASRVAQEKVNRQLQQILGDTKLSDNERELKILKLAAETQQQLVEDVFNEAKAADNPLAHQVMAGAVGNKFMLNSLLGADMQYVDHRDQPIPLPVTRSYSRGLTPAEYFAASFGTRKGVIDVKTATADAGFFGKQLTQVAHRLLVTADDDDDTERLAQAINRGLPSDVDDPDNEGALLARDAGPYKRNTVLTPKILRDLKESGVKDILVRSPLVGGPDDGGVYAKDVGYREKGRLPPIGDFTGIAAAQALSEPVSQSQLSSKHCLAAGTLVRMADWTVKRIEDICAGDMVLGADKNARTFPSRVVQTYDNGLRECVKTVFKVPYNRASAHVELLSTLDHKILMFRRVTNSTAEVDNWTPQLLPVGTPTGRLAAIMPRRFDDRAADVIHEPFTRYPRQTLEKVGQLPTYDIEVENEDHLFVLANGLIVSNSGGVGGAKAIGGFKAINALVQVPRRYPDGAAHAQRDGTVQEIRPAAQGGFYVSIAGEDHYVPADRELTVKKGDPIDAGDVLSDGMPNPAEVVRHKGVGEGRRYFVQAMRQVLSNSGVTAHRRNIELLARGLINHVRLTDEYGDYVSDDIVPYSSLERNWQPRSGSVAGNPGTLNGHYLETPALHYSIGTRITRNVAENLKKYGITNVQAHKEPPPFQPEMVRGMANISNDPDWMTRMLGSYQEKGLLQSVHKGLKSDEAGSSYVPALARGEQFGFSGPTSGWKPQSILNSPQTAPSGSTQGPLGSPPKTL